jgi:hypothetical protein
MMHSVFDLSSTHLTHRFFPLGKTSNSSQTLQVLPP